MLNLLSIPVICFPREIKNYKEFCDIVKPDASQYDYNVRSNKNFNELNIPFKEGLIQKYY